MSAAHWTAGVSKPSRIMLPVYCLLAVGLGLVYLLTPTAELVTAPVNAAMNERVPLRAWGAAFLSAGVQLTGCVLSLRWAAEQVALGVLMAWLAVWGACSVIFAARGGATWAAPLWPLALAAACLASLVSVSETSQEPS